MSVTELDARTITDALEVFVYGDDCAAARNRSRPIRTYAAGRVTYGAREVYSYGSHFPLARYVPRALNGAHDLFLINGDTWRGGGGGWNVSRTFDHQATTRAWIARSGVRSLIVPFSALDGAGIDRDSVRLIDTRPDKVWEETRYAERLQDVPRHERTRGEYVPRYADSLDDMPEHYRREWIAGEYRETEPDADGRYSWTEYVTRDKEPDADGRYSWTVTIHRLGDSLFSGVRESHEWRAAEPFETERETARETVSLRDADGRVYCASAEDSRHVAGPSAACVHCGKDLRADVTYRTRARYLSSFDANEVPPLYFLCQVPRGAGETVAAALDSLAPRAVHAAHARGLTVQRQGDIFYIETALTDGDLAARGIRSRARLTQWTRDARARKGETGYAPALNAAGRRKRDRYARRVWRETFRAAVDAATESAALGSPVTERGARARWRKLRAAHARELELARAELRRAALGVPLRRSYSYGTRAEHARRARTARERYDARRARGVRDAHGFTSRAHARDAYRTRYGTNARAAWSSARAVARAKYEPNEWNGASIEKRRAAVRAAVAIYGTAHSATEVIRTGSGTYARGIARHVPDLEPGRDGGRDHAEIALGEKWYLAVRNTVPRQGVRRRRRNGRASDTRTEER